MFKVFYKDSADTMKERGLRTCQTRAVIDGKVDVCDEELTVGGYKLTDFINELVTWYGKEIKIEVKVTVNL